jgi:hypothetical protein
MLMFSLGQDDSVPAGWSSELDHSLVPFRSRARYLRLVATLPHALDYAAGGFHVSVTRGLCGGAADPAVGFAAGGTKAGACAAPLNRDDLRQLWSNAAQAYHDAYSAIIDGHPLDRVKVLLHEANLLADKAYAGENVEPPRDPKTGAPETPSPRRANWLAVAGLVGVSGMLLFGIHRSRQAHGEYWV